MATYTNWKTSVRRLEDLGLLLICVLICGFLATHTTLEKWDLSYAAWFGCFFVASAWGARVDSRLREAELPRWYVFPIVCGPICILGLIWQFKFIGGLVALVLFVFTQVPIAFLRRKPKPDEMEGAPPLTHC